jgi:hypothetical protein
MKTMKMKTMKKYFLLFLWRDFMDFYIWIFIYLHEMHLLGGSFF